MVWSLPHPKRIETRPRPYNRSEGRPEPRPPMPLSFITGGIALRAYDHRGTFESVGALRRLGERPQRTKLSPRHKAMEVSSVHCPGCRLNGPPPIISEIGAKVPGGLNSKVVPKASPQASPRRAPRCGCVIFLCFRLSLNVVFFDLSL